MIDFSGHFSLFLGGERGRGQGLFPPPDGGGREGADQGC